MKLHPIIEIDRSYLGIPEWRPSGFEIFCVLLGLAFITTMIWIVIAIGILFASVMGIVKGFRRLWIIGRW